MPAESSGEKEVLRPLGHERSRPPATMPAHPRLAGELSPTVSFDREQAASDPLIGATLSNYHVLSHLGQGGFGTVYKARDLSLDRFVALKFLRFPLKGEHHRRFVQEAKLLASLGRHPGIVQIHAWHEHDDHPYFVLEYLESSVESLLLASPGGLVQEEVLRIVGVCAQAVAFAHEQGVLHLDIKPANILIDRNDRRVKLCDFGLARLRSLVSSEPNRHISGSPPFMSPEQVACGPLDARSDVFALGVTLYLLLSGQRPYTGVSTAEIMAQITRGDSVPLDRLLPDMDARLLAVVVRAMAIDPDDRYPTVREFMADLDQVSAATGLLDGGKSRPSKKRRALRLIGSGIAAAMIAAVFFLVQNREPGTPGMPSVMAAAMGQLDHREYALADASFRRILAGNPEDETALLGLGYACLFQKQADEAREAFSNITDEALRNEALAVLAHAEADAGADLAIQRAVADSPTGYGRVLAASLSLATGDISGTMANLDEVTLETLRFGWQREEYFRVLGVALMKSGDFDGAASAFERAADNEDAHQPLTAALLEISRERSGQSLQAETGARVARIKDLMKQAETPQTPVDAWRSRPMALLILSPRVSGQGNALSSGLSDALPWLLARELTSAAERPLEVVERNVLGSVLGEQELSAQLGGPGAQLQLGRMIGARILVQCEFSSLYGKEYLRTSLVDTETTSHIPLSTSEVLAGDEELATWIATVAKEIQSAITRAYPLRGHLTTGLEGPRVDLGVQLGLTTGAKLRVLTEPDSAYALPNTFAIVNTPVERDSAPVTIEGLSTSNIPPEGYFVEETVSNDTAVPPNA